MRDIGKKKGAVLAGGGFKGLVQAVQLSEFHKARIQFDVVCGVSIGALNGALVVQGDSSLLVDLWSSVAEAGPRGGIRRWPIYKLPFKRSLYSSDRVRELIESTSSLTKSKAVQQSSITQLRVSRTGK
jgi:predicted acylesterase/phospholipase RssA